MRRVEPDMAAMGDHDLSCQCQADTGAFALGREERHKDFLRHVGGDPGAVVLDLDDHMAALVELSVQVHTGVRCLSQCLLGVFEQVDQYLFDHVPVG